MNSKWMIICKECNAEATPADDHGYKNTICECCASQQEYEHRQRRLEQQLDPDGPMTNISDYSETEPPSNLDHNT